MVLFLKVDRSDVSDDLWDRWQEKWQRYSRHVDALHPNFSQELALAIAMARDDKVLLLLTYQALRDRIEDYQELENIVADVLRVVVFMKAATTQNRVSKNLIKFLRTTKRERDHLKAGQRG